MPRGQHPNSLANLKKGKATQFGVNGDSRAKAAQAKGKLAQMERKSIAEEMHALADETDENGSSRRKALAEKLVLNMEKSPEWYKLGLRMLGELPPEQVEVSRPAEEMAEEIREALVCRRAEIEAAEAGRGGCDGA